MFTPSVAVVGGGASGAMVAIHLLRLARTPLRVTLIDRDGRHAQGQAYSTTDPRHLLNACAGTMSAVDDEPGHFVSWARAAGLAVGTRDFLPRPLYGRYLRETLAAAENLPARSLHRLTGTATALRGDRTVLLADGRGVDADAVVLALGNRAPAPVPGLAPHPRYVADPWRTGALARIGDGTPVLVLGTGLTMIDVALTATRAHPETVVFALSRHALLPRSHPSHPAVPVPPSFPEGALRVADLLAAVRRAVRENGGDWHGVVDGLRPHVPALWSRLSPDERRVFLRRVARYWEIHRHRLPPASATATADLRAQGRLRVLRGRLLGADPLDGRLRVRADLDGATRELDVGWLVNATGPDADVTAEPLVADLVTTGRARPDPTGLGLEAGPAGAILDAEGRPSRRISALGPPLRGALYETTAVPEIRAQAAALASRLAGTLASRATLSGALPKDGPGGAETGAGQRRENARRAGAGS